MASNLCRERASLLLMVASGFAGLGYQMVWTQQCALWLGHEAAAVLAVVAAFFGGLALGSLSLGARVEKSARPARWYAACELVIALWGLLLVFAIPHFSATLLHLTGVQPTPAWQWAAAFFGTFLLLLPSTAAMGATLPALERITSRLQKHDEVRSIAALYAGNTFGAVLGVLGTAFWLIPAWGLARTAIACVALNVLCAATALLVFPQAAESAPPATANTRPPKRDLLARLALTGFLGIGYEVRVVRVLSQVSEDTVYTFAMLLAVYLLGTAAGAAGYQRWLFSRRKQAALADALFGALSAACLLGTASLWGAEWLKAGAQQMFGNSAFAAIVAEAVPAVFAFGPPTIAMGALFSHLARRASTSGIGFGRALGVNTLGAAAAPAVFGVLIAPTFGAKFALLLIGVGYLALASRRAWTQPMILVPAAAALALAVLAPALTFIDVREGGRVVSYEDGVMAAVSVIEDDRGVARLRIDNRQQEGSSATQRVDGRQAWLPLLLHPAPRRALFLGLGTGITASSGAEDPTLRVDAVELLPEVIRASAHFSHSLADGAAYARLNILAGDARRYVRTSTRSYDVIVSDNFHPARSGSGALYTVEHFEAVRRRLEAGGVFCQWLPLHQLDLGTLRSIVASFVAVYPEGWAMIASNSLETPVLGLVGRQGAVRFDAARVRKRIASAALPDRLTGIGLEDEFAVLGSFVAGPAALRRFASDASLNSDDHPVVAYRAPRSTYAPDSSPGERLTELLSALSIAPDELILPSADAAWSARLAAYWAARDRFIASGRDVHPSARVEEMLAQVREPLLSVLRISPDFRLAYDPLFSMATALANSDIAGARALLTELSQIQPARNDAALALAQISATPSADPATR
ncbi:MAG: MnmC family methyltransferase [Pseudomonadota bacterium]